MASILIGAAHVAHSAAASLLSTAQITVGNHIPTNDVKENDPEKPITLDLTGKNIIVCAHINFQRRSRLT